MRVGELCALKWPDVNFEEHKISITKTYYNPKNIITGYKLQTPKTASSKRTIEVDMLVTKELEKHQGKQNVVKMQHRKEWHDKNFVFVKTDKITDIPTILNSLKTE